MCDFPVCDEKLVDKELEADMDEVLKIVVLGRAARNSANIKNRQPIGNMYVKAEKELVFIASLPLTFDKYSRIPFNCLPYFGPTVFNCGLKLYELNSDTSSLNVTAFGCRK